MVDTNLLYEEAKKKKKKVKNLFNIQTKFISVNTEKTSGKWEVNYSLKRLCNESFDSFALEADGDDSVSLPEPKNKLYIN